MLGMTYIKQKLRLCTRNGTTQAQSVSQSYWVNSNVYRIRCNESKTHQTMVYLKQAKMP